MDKEKDTGRCVNCGFLSKKEREQSVSICYEATTENRSVGNFEDIRGHIRTKPWCFVNKTNYSWDEYNRRAKYTETLLKEITQERNCPYWYSWKEGVSPKEHYEEYQMLELERKREEFEQKMEKERKEFELKLDESNREERKRTDRIMIWLTIALVFFAIIQVVCTVLTLIYSNR